MIITAKKDLERLVVVVLVLPLVLKSKPAESDETKRYAQSSQVGSF